MTKKKSINFKFIINFVSLMVQNTKVARNYFVFQNGTSWNVNTISMICYYNNSTLKTKEKYYITNTIYD